MSEPGFQGQRPPFESGNDAATRHGATSPRRIGPLAAQIEQEARAAAWWPNWLDDESYVAEVQAWTWSEAQVRLLRDYVGELDLTAAMAELNDATETETRSKTRTVRVTAGKRTRSALAELERAEARAARLRSRLGLEPTSRARLMRDLSAGRYLTMLTPAHPLEQAVDRALAERRPGQLGQPEPRESSEG